MMELCGAESPMPGAGVTCDLPRGHEGNHHGMQRAVSGIVSNYWGDE